jgi:vacuolar iron transporter family protein
MLNPEVRSKVLRLQRNEITEHFIYGQLATLEKQPEKSAILQKLSAEELNHYNLFKWVTERETPPDKFKVARYVFFARALGLNFVLRSMENGESAAQKAYDPLRAVSPKLDEIIRDEERHESALLNMIDEERLRYVSSVVLGLNDALVELTGALVGFTLALQNTRLVAIVGLITGIAASMSMAASEYLSTKHEASDKNPLKASVYTGCTYVSTVILLVLPYFLINNIFVCLAAVVLFALLIIFLFTYYVSVAKNLDFKKRFFEMAGISLGIAAVNFGIGLIVRKVFGISV